MPWVRFNKAFRFPVTQAVTQRYPVGFTGNVTTRCADMAEAQGKAIRIPTPRKGGGSRRWRSKRQFRGARR